MGRHGIGAWLLGCAACGAIAIGWLYDERLFGPDPYKSRAYAFAAAVALAAALSVFLGIAEARTGRRRVRTTAGIALGALAFVAAALFAFATMLVGG